MREERANQKISDIERSQAELRESIAASEQLAARAEMLLSGSRRTIGGGGEAQA
jgi:hypothetical protein